jgi:hypothetical protein
VHFLWHFYFKEIVICVYSQSIYILRSSAMNCHFLTVMLLYVVSVDECQAFLQLLCICYTVTVVLKRYLQQTCAFGLITALKWYAFMACVAFVKTICSVKLWVQHGNCRGFFEGEHVFPCIKELYTEMNEELTWLEYTHWFKTSISDQRDVKGKWKLY